MVILFHKTPPLSKYANVDFTFKILRVDVSYLMILLLEPIKIHVAYKH
jgi:hypothetical protein